MEIFASEMDLQIADALAGCVSHSAKNYDGDERRNEWSHAFCDTVGQQRRHGLWALGHFW
jgi:hypothetical protein